VRRLTLSIALNTLGKALDGAITSFEGFTDFIYDQDLLGALYGLQGWLSQLPEQPKIHSSDKEGHCHHLFQLSLLKHWNNRYRGLLSLCTITAS